MTEEKILTLGSLFDGIGGFILASKNIGIKPIWASEIEKFPIEVTKYHYPEVKHLGDITKLDGSKIEKVDIITAGSPCQDLSLAKKGREGLKGSKSSLFLEVIRIIKEMRKSSGTNESIYPRYFVWENVCGAFSSNKGEDFRCILEEISKICDETVYIPRPPKNKWRMAGSVVGGSFSICWRVLNAEYFGVAQRRRRVFLIADFGSNSSGEILFEREVLQGYFKKSEEKRTRNTKNIRRSTNEARKNDIVYCMSDRNYSINKSTTLMHSLGGLPIVMSRSQGGAEIGINKCPTITASAGTSGNNMPLLFENHGKDSRYTGPLEIAPTITSTYGMGGNNVPFVVEQNEIDNKTYCISGHILNRKEENGGNGLGITEEKSYTLTTNDIPSVVNNRKLIRKILPIECERLMGYPDNYTNINNPSDSKRYKTLGNSVVVPCVEFVLMKIKENQLINEKTCGKM